MAVGNGVSEPLLSPETAPARGRKRWLAAYDPIAALRRRGSDPAATTVETYLCLALIFGFLSGLLAYVYITYLNSLVDAAWTWLPAKAVLPLLEHLDKRWTWFPAPSQVAWVYTVLLAALLGTLAGAVQKYMGFPGDLPDTVANLHTQGFVPIEQAPSMFLCSAFSIAAGGSLGPEAPLLALCAGCCSWVATNVFHYRGRLMRNCTLMGMSAALSALFGVSLGGSLFALEVLHRTGLQYYEILTFSVLSGLVCLLVFRGLAGLPFGSIWDWGTAVTIVDFRVIMLGAAGGVLGAGLALLFMSIVKWVKKAFQSVGLDEHKTPVWSGLVGGVLIGMLGVLLPPTMFWGEFEIQTIANPASPLPHIWPKGGIWGLEPFMAGGWPAWLFMLVAAVKLVAIAITVLSGFRGGFIFPVFMAGSALGHGISMIPNIPFVSSVPPVMLSMTIAAGIDVAITRTPFATSLILTTLCGHPEVMAPCLCSALVSLFLTLNYKFIQPQGDRGDLELKDIWAQGYSDMLHSGRVAHGDAHPEEMDVPPLPPGSEGPPVTHLV